MTGQILLHDTIADYIKCAYLKHQHTEEKAPVIILMLTYCLKLLKTANTYSTVQGCHKHIKQYAVSEK